MNLTETQIFDFDFFKDRIKKFIIYTLDAKQPVSDVAIKKQFQNIFYDIIRNDKGGRLNSSKKLGFTDNDVSSWRKYFSGNGWDVSGPWSQRNFNAQLTRKSGKDKTYNFYITLDKTKNNIIKFWNSVSNLDKELSLLSNSENSPISYKLHGHLDYLVEDNDSLKIYYYDSNLKSKVENVVKKWASQNNVNISPRSHLHGVDVRFNPNDNKNSFGEIASKKIAEIFFDVIKKHGTKHSEDKYFEWIKKHFSEILSKIEVK